MAKLKVYHTAIGFHDAYVAAPSQKAALTVWGADANLFARGVAEEVTDAELTAEPLAHPGEVIKRLRGSAAEQLAAAVPIARKPRREAASPAPLAQGKPKAAPPRPERDVVEAAEAALATAERKQRDQEQQLAAEEQGLAERRRAMRLAWLQQRGQLEAARDEADAGYAEALRKWQASS